MTATARPTATGTTSAIPLGPPGPALEVAELGQSEPQLLCMMVVQRPDRMAGHRDNPLFALYADGRVIFTPRGSGKRPGQQAQLGADGAEALARKLATRGFADLPHEIGARGRFAYEAIEIVMRYDQRWKRVVAQWGPDLPPAFMATLKQIKAFDHPSAEPWQPDQILAMFSMATGKAPAVPWPADLPSPAGGINVIKGFGSLRLDAEHEPTVRALVDAGKPVRVERRAYQLTYSRVPPELETLNAVRRAFIQWRADQD